MDNFNSVPSSGTEVDSGCPFPVYPSPSRRLISPAWEGCASGGPKEGRACAEEFSVLHPVPGSL